MYFKLGTLGFGIGDFGLLVCWVFIDEWIVRLYLVGGLGILFETWF